MRTILLSMILAVSFGPSAAEAQPSRPGGIPVLLDTDIGEDIDDAFALAAVLASPELDLLGVTTVGKDSYKRAQMVARFLTAVGVKAPVAAGLPEKTTKPLPYWQVQYGNHASVYFRDPKPVKVKAPEFLYQQLKAKPGAITLLAIGPLTNIAKLLSDHPDCKPMIKRIVLMGGSVRRGYAEGSKPELEYNIVQDVQAAEIVFRAGVPLVVAPLDATAMLKLDAARQRRLFAAGSLLTLSLQALVQLWQEKNAPVLYDPVAVTLSYTEQFCTMEDLALEVDAKGFTRIVKGAKPNARVATAIQKDAFLDWFVERLAKAYPKSLPSGRVVNSAKMTPRGKMPNRVHASEDFETDIEKRWWLAGRIETKNVPPRSTRALRGVLTQDFDDRQGETKTLHTAVVFNPVPGPPMGKKPHLSFRYFLKGTDTLRVQIYSLTNGYHRCLTLTGLPQGKWMQGNVNMQDARKPDGAGGPLAENERIDDIQFYCDPRAELLIDDIVLYDAAVEGEDRPFPQRILFTGWFDSGKQGKEWPGSFTIAPKEGYFWHAAKSVACPEYKNSTWIDLDLRGDRLVGATTELFFRCKLEGKVDRIKIQAGSLSLYPKLATKGAWTEMVLNVGASQEGKALRRITIYVTPETQFWIDDLLLYEPGQREK